MSGWPEHIVEPFRRSSARGWLRRIFWAAMLGLHLGPIAACWRSLAAAEAAPAAIRLGILLTAAVFFALKVADVPWLRVKPGWRTWVASSIVIALLHLGAVDRAAGTRVADTPGHLGIVLFIGAVFCRKPLGATASRIASAFVRLLQQHVAGRCEAAAARTLGLKRPQWVLAGGVGAPRSPPSC